MQIHHLAVVFPSLVFGWRHVPEKGITSKKNQIGISVKSFFFMTFGKDKEMFLHPLQTFWKCFTSLHQCLLFLTRNIS